MQRPPAVPPPPASKNLPKSLPNEMPPAEMSETKNMTSAGGDQPTLPAAVNQIKTAEYRDDYVSCPPPSTPPPPLPPQVESEKEKASKISKSQPKKSESKACPVNTSNPPPIPSRPRPAASQNKPDQPPPIPGRSSLMQPASSSPRKNAE